MAEQPKTESGTVMADDVRSIQTWQLFRTVMQGAILAGVMWLASNVQSESAASIRLQTQMSAVADELHNMRSQLDGVPALAQQIAQDNVRLDEHERRITTLEAIRREQIRRSQ